MDIPILKSSYSGHLQHTINYLRYLDRQSPLFGIDGGDKVNAEVAVDTAIRSNAQCHWLQIFSLTREDYDRLDLNRDYMRDLVTAKRDEIARIYNITPSNLRIFASLHDKDHHPHLHMVFFSLDPREGFVRGNEADKFKGLKVSSTKLKSVFVNEIFREEAKEIYIAKSNTRKQLNEQLRALAREVVAPTYLVDRAVKEKMILLRDALKDQGGKLTYGYLPQDKKALVSDVLKAMVDNDPVVSQLFESYKQLQFELIRRYASDETVLNEKLEKWELDFFSPSKKGDASRHNSIIKAALQIDSESASSKTEIASEYHAKNASEAMQTMLYTISLNLKNNIVNDAATQQNRPDTRKRKALMRRHKNIVQLNEEINHQDR